MISTKIFVFDTMCVNNDYTPLDYKFLELKTYNKYKDILLKDNFNIDIMKWKGDEKYEFIKQKVILYKTVYPSLSELAPERRCLKSWLVQISDIHCKIPPLRINF